MKRIAIIAGIVLLLAVVGIIIISGQKPKSAGQDKPTKVGMLMIGSRAESSWNEAHWQGIQEAARELNLDIDCEENVEAPDCAEVIDQMVRRGCKIIISTSIDYENSVLQAAQAYPKIYFFQATGTKNRPNLANYMGRMYQMRYLAGIAAGCQSQSGQIGYVTTEAIPEVVRGIDAFTFGVRKANPQARVYVKYTGSWTDEDKARSCTEELLDKVPGIDVLGTHLDTDGVLEIAMQHHILAIGCNTDQSGLYPDIYLTAPIWKWDIFYTKYIREALNNKFEGRDYLVGAETGIVGLVPLHLQKDDGTAHILRMERERIANGTFDVFYGPIYDNQGILRAAEGENLSDRMLFQELDWYVEGVVLP